MSLIQVALSHCCCRTTVQQISQSVSSRNIANSSCCSKQQEFLFSSYRFSGLYILCAKCALQAQAFTVYRILPVLLQLLLVPCNHVSRQRMTEQIVQDCMVCFAQYSTVGLLRCIIIIIYIVRRFLPERDYVTFGSLLSQFRLSSVVCNVGAPYSRG